MWHIDDEERFHVGSEEFIALMGPNVAGKLGRSWSEIASDLSLDPDGRLAHALASRDTWSGIVVLWPIEGAAERLPVELSGLPVFDRDRVFRGYRGFGVCRDVSRLAAMVAHTEEPTAIATTTEASNDVFDASEATSSSNTASAEPTRPVLTIVPQVKNVVPFRTSAPTPDRRAVLTPVEHSAFEEIARALGGDEAARRPQEVPEIAPPAPAPAAAATPDISPTTQAPAAPPALSTSAPDERAVLDRIPLGVLVHRSHVVLYANRTLLEWTGYEDAQAITAAGGLDRLFAESALLDETPGGGERRLSITTRENTSIPVEGRLFSISWEGETALLTVLTDASEEHARAAAANERDAALTVSELAMQADDERLKALELAARTAQAASRELESVLDTATDGVLVVDRDGMILASNRSAEALFGYDSHELAHRSFIDLFAPESHRIALDYLGGLAAPGVASLLNDGRELIGRVRQGGLDPAVHDDRADCRRNRQILRRVPRHHPVEERAEEELTNAKRQAEKASSAKSDFLAKISHEIRTPLNAIIGFSEVMLEERFGPIGNERYSQYLKDIHASGGHLISLVNDLLDLSKIEAGKLDLHFTSVGLNDVVQQCVAHDAAAGQSRAGHHPHVAADDVAADRRGRTIDASGRDQSPLQLAEVHRRRRTGDRFNRADRSRRGGAADSRYRRRHEREGHRDGARSRSVRSARRRRSGKGGTGLGLPLTKALAEANRASFTIRSGVNAGTLVEIAFPSPRVLAE